MSFFVYIFHENLIEARTGNVWTHFDRLKFYAITVNLKYTKSNEYDMTSQKKTVTK